MRFYIVSCDPDRAERMTLAASPLGLDMQIVRSPWKDDPEVLHRGRGCFQYGSYPSGVAATLGHIRAMKEFLKTGDPIAAIAEDDVRFHGNFRDVARRVENYLNVCSDANVISMGFVNLPHGTVENVGGVMMIRNVGISNPWGCQCYALTRDYARHFVKMFEVDDIASVYQGVFVTDWVIFDPALGCRRHTLVEPVAIESPLEQSIVAEGRLSNKPDLFRVLDHTAYLL
jgi:GR25 family glycosyltransferase involved in LPS biosynthesis